MKLRSIFSSLLAVALLVGLTTSCEDEFNTVQDGVKTLKTTVVDGAFDVVHPDFVNPEEEFTVSFEAQCGNPVLEIWDGEAWATVATGNCETTEFTTSIEDYGVYSLRVSLTEGACECVYVGLPSDVINITVCRIETAFGGDDMFEGKGAWWYWFDVAGYWLQEDGGTDPETGDPIDIPATEWADWETVLTADQDVEIGDVTLTYNEIGEYFELVIVLDEGWILNPDCVETVKVQGMDDLPNKRPTAGKFDLKGDVLTVVLMLDEVPYINFENYVIHMDVKTCDVPYYGIELID